ncbi:MAG: zinc ribbon domain-containing protein [Chloroflexi bacterium]|nr:zinc ribbon domain-containing protein [Chloroflexota bacterium]
MMTIHCPHCGVANRAGSNFCNRCGTDLRTDEPTIATRSDPALTESLPSPDEVTPSSNLAAQTALPADEQTPHDTPLPEESTPPAELTIKQLWLQDEALFAPSDPSEISEFEQDLAADDMPSLADSGRLIIGVQGLLEPLRISSEIGESSDPVAPTRYFAPGVALGVDQLRSLRGLMTHDPVLLHAPPLYRPRQLPALRVPWIFVLLGLMVALPIFLLFGQPVGQVQQWPGVAEAHAQVENLPADASVLILWAYDPATADEMDLLALPLVMQLFARQTQPIVVSLLPNGLPTAHRLFARAIDDLLADPRLRTQAARAHYIEGGFFAGGATALPLLGQNLRNSLLEATTNPSPELVNAVAQPPVVAVVIAAQAEDVQHWLELVQPLNQIPVLAFTSAGADAPLRPYLDSGQLRGLVSGFDGAYAYQQLLTYPLSRGEETVYRLQLVFQNWGHLAFLVLIVLGNLAALIYARS